MLATKKMGPDIGQSVSLKCTNKLTLSSTTNQLAETLVSDESPALDTSMTFVQLGIK